MRNIYAKGINFSSFLELASGEDRDITLRFLEKTELKDELVDRIKAIDRDIKVLVLGEIWCPDCRINMPAMEIINRLNPRIDFRIIPREGNEMDFEGYMVDGKVKIPTFIIMDKDYKELGHILERPKKVKDFYDRGDQLEIIKNSKLYREGYFIVDMVEEILSYID